MNKTNKNGVLVLEVAGLTVSYNNTIVIENVNFRLQSPGLVQVIGPNGAGKTTLLKAILGLVKPVKGVVYVNGGNVTGSPSKIGRIAGYLPQTPQVSVLSPITVWELVEGGLLMRNRQLRHKSKILNDAIRKALLSVGLDESIWYKRVWELSGGQRQRAFLARAIAHDPKLIVLDEPLAAVDPTGRSDLASLIGSFSRDKLVIVAGHEPHLLLPYTKVVILVNKRIVAIGEPSNVLRGEHLAKIYGDSLVEGVLVGEGGAHG